MPKDNTKVSNFLLLFQSKMSEPVKCLLDRLPASRMGLSVSIKFDMLLNPILAAIRENIISYLFLCFVDSEVTLT